MKKLIFAANWKMNLGPESARQFLKVFLQRYQKTSDREVWFFPPAVSLEAVFWSIRDRSDMLVGAQNVYWEKEGAFTGELSIPMGQEAGAQSALVGHSERRHVFGETDEETGRKVRALLETELIPVLCVGEKLEEREGGNTLTVVERQLSVLQGLDPVALGRVVVAYEPVWAIGTGRNATPEDAGEVHEFIRSWIGDRGVSGDKSHVLYGGSVKPENAASLLSHPEIDGVLVGGASQEPESWAALTQTGID